MRGRHSTEALAIKQLDHQARRVPLGGGEVTGGSQPLNLCEFECGARPASHRVHDERLQVPRRYEDPPCAPKALPTPSPPARGREAAQDPRWRALVTRGPPPSTRWPHRPMSVPWPHRCRNGRDRRGKLRIGIRQEACPQAHSRGPVVLTFMPFCEGMLRPQRFGGRAPDDGLLVAR